MKDDKLITCPINGKSAYKYATLGRAEYYFEPIDGVIFQKVLPTVSAMEQFSQREYKGGVYRAYFEAEALKKNTAKSRLNQIKTYKITGDKLLDVGCSVGFFLEVAKDFGYQVQGVELSSEAASYAKDSVRSSIYVGDANLHIKEFENSYDVVTAYDIIEHTQNPVVFLSELRKALVPGGVLAISAPDTDHFLRYVMGKRWPMLQPYQHTYLFSKRGIGILLSNAGFENIQVRVAKKTITINYLFNQLNQTNPWLASIGKVIKAILPKSLGDRSIEVNIGEFFAIATRPAKNG